MGSHWAAAGNGKPLVQEEPVPRWAPETYCNMEGAGDSQAQRAVEHLHWEWGLQPNSRDATSSQLVVYMETCISAHWASLLLGAFFQAF